MLTHKRFILWGLSRLTVRVAQAMAADGASVTVVCLSDDLVSLRPLLQPPIQLLVYDCTAQAGDVLLSAGLPEASCLLALSETDLDNLRAAVAARETAPDVPVVLRAFDPTLADQLEQGLNVRRAYSVSALAAPAFVAAACGDVVLETLRLGDGEVPICQLTLRTDSPLIGLSTREIKSKFGCAILARSWDGANWQSENGENANTVLDAGEQVLVGGPRDDVLRTVVRNAGWRKSRGRKRHTSATLTAPRSTRLPQFAIGLTAVLVGSVFVFAHALHLRVVDAVYFVVTTATTTGYGDISLKDAPDWVKLFGCFVMLAGGALLGILFSLLAAAATAERLDETMSRRARRMSCHVVVVGLGNLGYRVTRQMLDLGLKAVVLDLAPRPRFAETLRSQVPILSGDASLADNLQRVSIESAKALIACTNDDLANIQTCLHARRLNPAITTVARVFDETLVAALPRAFAIDHALSASHAAVSAFVGAATDERALRSIPLGDLDLLAGRYQVETALTGEKLSGWRQEGIRVLAFRTKTGSIQPPSELVLPLAPGAELILCGPSSVLRQVIGHES